MYYANCGMVRFFDDHDVWGFDKAGKGDTITLILDTKKQKLFIEINNNRQRCAVDLVIGEGIKYRLRVAMNNSCSIKILGFEQQ